MVIDLIKILVLFLIYSLFGTALHFLFKLSNKSIVIGIIASVNESVWEHIKLLLTPIFVYSFVEFLIGKEHNFFVFSLELLLSIILIIIFYEIKVKIFKNKYGFINIISFLITSFIIATVHYNLRSLNVSNTINGISLIIVIVVFIMYLTFTVFPPKIKYFKDPITGTYGINEYVNKSV